MDQAPTIRTLAAAAGVSKATVSLALRNHPRIREEVRLRIQKLAEEAGYQPNALVTNLLTQLRSSQKASYQSTLGLVYMSDDPVRFKSFTTYQEWVAGCRARAAQVGYKVDEFSLHESSLSPERLVSILKTRNIQGLVVLGPFPGNVIPPALDVVWQRSSSIVVGVRPVHPRLSCVSNDQFSTAAHAVEEVVRLGYRRPGYCLDPEVDNWVEDRFIAGYGSAVRRAGLKKTPPPFAFHPDDEAGFRKWVEKHRPDVILSMHMEIENWLKKMGLKAPDDIGLAHLDRTSTVKRWAGMSQNNESIGIAAVDMVVGQLHRNETGVPLFQKNMFISGSWLPGVTVRQAG